MLDASHAHERPPMSTTAAPLAVPSTALLPAVAGDALGQARAWADLASDERRRRASAAAVAHDGRALAALADAYLTLRGSAGATVSAHTRRAYRTGILALVAAWREENLLHPGQEAAAIWLRALETGGASPSTARVRLAGGRLLYRALRWTRATAADPFTDTRAAPDRTAPWDKRSPYTPEEIAQLLGAASVRDQVLVLLGAHAGLRVAEACAVRWEAVDLATGRLAVEAGKGGKRRVVPLSGSLRAALLALGPGKGEERVAPITADVVRERIERLARKAGLRYRGYHALRHAAGTRAAREGLGLEGIATFLGHSNVQTSRIYQHWADESVRQTVSAW
jgi:integrase/recombinase XerC